MIINLVIISNYQLTIELLLRKLSFAMPRRLTNYYYD